MMTEAEAKEKWCPFVRYLATFTASDEGLLAAGTYNRGAANSGMDKARCIASHCMAWRWVPLHIDPDATSKDNQRGFCGLAGKP